MPTAIPPTITAVQGEALRALQDALTRAELTGLLDSMGASLSHPDLARSFADQAKAFAGNTVEHVGVNHLSGDVKLQFKVTFEATGFTNSQHLTEQQFTEHEAKGFTEISLAEGTFPKNVLAALGGRISEDDEQGKSDIHVFVCVDLLVEAESYDKAERMTPPEDLLTKISDLMSNGFDLDLEPHSWEVTQITELEAIIQQAKIISQQQSGNTPTASELVKIPEPKFFTGNWNHLFGPGSAETQCRIVLDATSEKLVAAQALRGRKYVLLDRIEFDDLEDSVLNANGAHHNPLEWDLEPCSEMPRWATTASHGQELKRGLRQSMPPRESRKLGKFTVGDGDAIMILAAQRMGLEPIHVDDAKRHLEGGAIHPMTAAAIGNEAANVNNRLRHDAALIAKANIYAEHVKAEYGFDVDKENTEDPDHWYNNRHELESGQVFNLSDGSVVRLDGRVPGDGTKWYVADWHEGWSSYNNEIEPGDLRGQPITDPKYEIKSVALASHSSPSP